MAGSSKSFLSWNSRSHEPPQIPGINRERCIRANRQINSAWNTYTGDDPDIYTLGISKILRTEFNDAANPYSTTLQLLFHSIDFFKLTTKSLSLETMKEFKRWLLDSGGPESFEKKYLIPLPSLQMLAFSIGLRQPNKEVSKLIFEVYCVHIIKEDLIKPISDLSSTGDYKTACIAATFLGLFSEFDIHKFLVPLLLQDREAIVVDYLIPCKAKQKELLNFLDGTLADRSPGHIWRNYAFTNKIENAKFEKFEVKPLGKLIDRLHAQFGIDDTGTNSGRRRRTGVLRYLMHRRYTEQKRDMSEAAFEELLDSTVTKDAELIDEAISLLRWNCDRVQAAKCALRHDVPIHKIPHEIQLEMQKINPNIVVAPDKAEVQPWDEDWEVDTSSPNKSSGSDKDVSSTITMTDMQDQGGFSKGTERPLTPMLKNPSKPARYTTSSGVPDFNEIDLVGSEKDNHIIYYACPLSTSSCLVVATPEAVDSFLRQFDAVVVNEDTRGAPTAHPFIVGIDCEWKPVLLVSEGAALIQIATNERIYLIDLVTLKKQFSASDLWIKLYRQFFMNERIMKLGFSFSQDLIMLSRSSPNWSSIKADIRGLLDLSSLAKAFMVACPQVVQTHGPGIGSSLADLVQALTGFRLNKSEQFSNWESRPMRESQITYAATDAYCLIDCFERLNQLAVLMKVDMNRMVAQLLVRDSPAGPSPKSKSLKRKELKDNWVKEILDRQQNRSVITANRTSYDSPFNTPTAADDVRIVCDSSCQGLGKQLRSCGINTLILGNSDDRTRCIDYALRDDRYIITNKSMYHSFAASVANGHCYALTAVDVIGQLQEVLCYFNVMVTRLDLYTRCQECNSNTFHKVRSCILKEMVPRVPTAKQRWNMNGTMDILNSDLNSCDPGLGFTPGEQNAAARKWLLLPESCLITDGPSDVLRTRSGAIVRLTQIPPFVLSMAEYFYVCDGCGKCWWARNPSTGVDTGNSTGSENCPAKMEKSSLSK